jgi:hypothetical protein
MDRLTVTFPSDKTGCPEFTPGKAYDVISVEQGWYRVVNDWGMDYLYPPEFFNEGEYTDGEYLKP